jgi:hypothetical protein
MHSLDPRVEDVGKQEEERVHNQGAEVFPEEHGRVGDLSMRRQGESNRHLLLPDNESI